MVKNDRSIAGALAGMAGAITQEIYAHLAKALGLTEKTFVDMAQVMVTYQNFKGPVAVLIEWLAHLTVGILVGIIFVQIFRYTSSKYWWLKGIIYGSILWFIFTGLGTLYKVPNFQIIDPKSAGAIWVGSVIYGLVTSYTLKLIDKNTELV